jgi:hypothetical protein
VKQKALILFSYLLIINGVLFTAINLYGLTQDIRPAGLFEDDLRFENDISLDYKQAKQQILRLPSENDLEYATRLNYVIAQSLAHIHWKKEQDATRYNQLIPIWENYFLHLMGRVTGIPEYEKYHYANYDRSLRRGIGNCGDASMIMSQLLNKHGIPNQIISFPGHVVVAAEITPNREFIFDADFGVSLPFSPDDIKQTPHLVNSFYSDAGYTKTDLKGFQRIYFNDYERWNGVSHFITKKYYFEIFAYWAKWPAPLLAILIAYMLIRWSKRQPNNSQC